MAGALILAAPASALNKHVFSTSFAGSGPNALANTGNGPQGEGLSSPSDVAVDQSTHDLYVTDPENHRVEKFSPSGEFILMFGEGVNKGVAEAIKAKEAHGESPTPAELQAEGVCTSEPGEECQPGTAGFDPVYLAVDNSNDFSAGDVYVEYQSYREFHQYEVHVAKFNSHGIPITAWGSDGQIYVESLPRSLTVDPSGDLFAGGGTELGQFGSPAPNSSVPGGQVVFGQDENDFVAQGVAVHEFGPTGTDLGRVTGPDFTEPPTALASDLSNGQLYIADSGGSIRHYDTACEPSVGPCVPTDSFGGPELGRATGLAVDESSEVVYAADPAKHRVDVFTPVPNLPDVTATAPTPGPSPTSTTLNADIDPAAAGEVSACHFSYLSDAAFKADQVNEVQALSLSGATGGGFDLTFEGQETGATGSGELYPEFNTIFTSVVASAGTFVPGEEVTGEGIPPGTVITFNGGEFFGISNPATSVGRVALATRLPYNVSAETVQNALGSISTIGSGNVEVSGPEGGPYAIEFTGAFARDDVPQLSADSSVLTPPGATASVGTTTQGNDGWANATTVACQPATLANSGQKTEVSAELNGLSTETTYHYRVTAINANGTAQSSAGTFTPHAVIGLNTEPPTHVTGAAATLNASLLGDGTSTRYHFQWGTTESYGNETPAHEFASPHGPEPTEFQADIEGLQPLTTYYYRVVAENGSGESSLGEDQRFTTPPGAPVVRAESVAAVHTESARVTAEIDPEAGDTAYHLEYGTAACSNHPDPCVATPALAGLAGVGTTYVEASVPILGLNAGSTYYFRIVAENLTATTYGADRTFTTHTFVKEPGEPCSNSHVRQQTSSAGLLDCRAYELVSAANAGGYDVESNLIPGQAPFAGYPEAEGRVLYGVQGGGIPGTNHPTDRGIDPYVATRGAEGWSTEYVGIPANATPSSAPFSSTLLGADAGLGTFAFGGSEICSPCFADGSTGEPLHLPSGELIQGMAGSEDPGPSAGPAGYIARPLSPDGTHFVFGSTSKFEPDGNEGQIAIYDRNLITEETHVVSKAPGNEDPPFLNIPCLINCSSNGIAELDISRDGSHILIGQLVAEKEGARYWHLYMNVGDSVRTVDLTPGAAEGVLFDGMSADGSKVFFSSEEHLTHEDEAHTGADIFMWEEGNPLVLISKGDSGSCDPVGNSAHEHWNVAAAEEVNCGAVAIGGGGGVSSANGTIYFLSPEKLAGSGSGVLNAPNLYRAGPADAYATHYVTTLESSLDGPQPPKQTNVFRRNLPPSFTDATGLALDDSSGDFYVLDDKTNTVEKFDSSGSLVTSFGDTEPSPDGKLHGSKTAAGSFSEDGARNLPTQLAVDNSCALHKPEPLTGATTPTCEEFDPSNGDLYVPDFGHGVVDKFSPSGKFLSEIKNFPEQEEFGVKGFPFSTGSPEPTGVAVDPSNGDVYVSNFYGANTAYRYPTGPSGDVYAFDSSGEPQYIFNPFEPGENFAAFPTKTEAEASSLAVDSAGRVYVTRYGGVTDFYSAEGEHKGELPTHSARSVSVDPANGDVYADEGTEIAQFDSSGIALETLGQKNLSGSLGLALEHEGNLYATNAGGTHVAILPRGLVHTALIDNPLVLDSVSEPEARHTADFQQTPSGNDAVFPSTLALAGGEEELAGHPQIFRYDASSEDLTCVSCTTTGEPSANNASLAPNGNSLSNDGRVFFDTADQLVAADTNGRGDVYEWEALGIGNCNEQSPSYDSSAGGCLALISAGTGSFDSGLLGVSANGVDAYFFTRDSLAPQDKNGPTMKIYDAREGGGFPYLFPEVTCKASDECHGAASPAPGPLQIGTESGSPVQGGHGSKSCKRGYVRKHGRCVHKPKSRRHKHHESANPRGGGHK